MKTQKLDVSRFVVSEKALERINNTLTFESFECDGKNYRVGAVIENVTFDDETGLYSFELSFCMSDSIVPCEIMQKFSRYCSNVVSEIANINALLTAPNVQGGIRDAFDAILKTMSTKYNKKWYMLFDSNDNELKAACIQICNSPEDFVTFDVWYEEMFDEACAINEL